MESFTATNNDGEEDINSSSRSFEDDISNKGAHGSSSFSHPQVFPYDDLTADTATYIAHNHILNAIHLEEKGKRETGMRDQIIAEVDEYKQSFYEKRNQKLIRLTIEKERRQVQIIPRELANIENKRGKKDSDKTPSVSMANNGKENKDEKERKDAKNGKGSKAVDSAGENKPASLGKDTAATANGGTGQPKPETSASAEADNKVKPNPDASK
ncbi:hypothetical protein F3Y22_tig00112800pilonHSYRG00061 [Hibiscus syriacus]|uniref:Uncharacterized protein n=1 Tax=Hibiscus syriacus TaxID=106335 RepID=A0A6A2XQV6_HIBSY|nr:hypothetical protein F3Y22_tig00112800pilonHSYRG00061 [Hibiscus syriacus]